jgi:hypothetical protein
MTPDIAARLARGQRAEEAYKEFIEPMIDELKNVYSDRIVEVANTELNRLERADKITALSNAHKILTTLDSGMLAMIRDGEMAANSKLHADKIERMSRPKQRLLSIGGYQ